MTAESVKRNAQAAAEDPPAPDPDGASVSDSTDPLAALIAERDQLAAEKTELQDRILRSQAEFQNSRKRAEKERLELAEYAKGMELIYQRFYESLKKLGLEPIVSTGQPFDPHIHHAVEMVETEEAADHTVLDEFQRGYNFKGRLLRPAMVKVAVEPASE